MYEQSLVRLFFTSTNCTPKFCSIIFILNQHKKIYISQFWGFGENREELLNNFHFEKDY